MEVLLFKEKVYVCQSKPGLLAFSGAGWVEAACE
jgi:hypothetical protein